MRMTEDEQVFPGHPFIWYSPHMDCGRPGDLSIWIPNHLPNGLRSKLRVEWIVWTGIVPGTN